MTMSSIRECVRCGGAVSSEGTCSVCGANNGGVDYVKQTQSSPVQPNPLSPQAVPVSVGLSYPSGRESAKGSRPAFLFNRATSERFQLNHSVSKIGRDQTNNISVPNDHYISRHHAWILQMHGGYWVEDLGSTNGTLLNGELLNERRQMVAGDRLTLGKTELVFAVE
jgi:hypothetical protein